MFGGMPGHELTIRWEQTHLVTNLPYGDNKRMNRDFMIHTRLYYPEVIKSTHPRYDTIVSVQDLLDQNTTNNVDDVDLC